MRFRIRISSSSTCHRLQAQKKMASMKSFSQQISNVWALRSSNVPSETANEWTYQDLALTLRGPPCSPKVHQLLSAQNSLSCLIWDINCLASSYHTGFLSTPCGTEGGRGNSLFLLPPSAFSGSHQAGDYRCLKLLESILLKDGEPRMVPPDAWNL